MHKTHRVSFRFLVLISSILFIVLLGCGSAKHFKTITLQGRQASDVLSNIRQKAVLRVGTTADFIPFSYHQTSDTTQFSGIDISLAQDLGKSLGVKVKLIKTTWPNLIRDLNANKFDIGMSGITITEKRKQFAYFSIPLLSSGKAVITRDENVDRFTSISAINKKDVRIIVNPGGTNEAFARANFPNAKIIQNDNNLSVFDKIVNGEVDLMVTDAMETLVQERIHPELEAVNPTKPFDSFQMGYLLPKDDKFKAFIDNWLQVKLKDSTFQNLVNRELDKFN